MNGLTEIHIVGRPVALYAAMLGIILLGLVVAQFIKVAIRKSGMDAMEADGAPHDAAASAKLIVGKTLKSLILPAVYIGSLYGGLSVLAMPEKVQRVLDTAALVSLIWFLVRFATHAVHLGFTRWFERKGQVATQQRVRPLLAIADIALWILAVIFLLDNLGFKISSIVAGLGIGGITVALASQAVLGDLFSYFVILFDRPFEIGDFIIAGDIMGVIESIGIKTTKVRSLSGELIVIANSQLTNSKVHNYKHMQRRRVVFTLGATYDTRRELLEAAPAVIRKAIEDREGTTFDRAHFKGFGQSSLDFEVVYYVESPDYLKYMDIQQAINLDLVENFQKLGISFAFPTMTVNLAEEKEIPPQSPPSGRRKRTTR